MASSSPRALIALLSTFWCLFSPTSALYFYLDGASPKCFYEELPKDTLVTGSYKAEAFNQQMNSYTATPDLVIQITVDETFDNDHRVVSQTSTSSDKYAKFTFSAADSGLHRLCFTPSGPAALASSGWFTNGGSAGGGVKLFVDMVIGESSKIESDDKGKLESIVGKVKELNGRLVDVRREQVFQREREAEFRDQSESVNSRIVRWSLIQLGVLGVTCAWQLSHLRAFFIKQKLT